MRRCTSWLSRCGAGPAVAFTEAFVLNGNAGERRISSSSRSALPWFSPGVGVWAWTIQAAGLQDHVPEPSPSTEAFSCGGPQVEIQIPKHQNAAAGRSSRRRASRLSDAARYPRHLFRASRAAHQVIATCAPKKKKRRNADNFKSKLLLSLWVL